MLHNLTYSFVHHFPGYTDVSIWGLHVEIITLRLDNVEIGK